MFGIAKRLRRDMANRWNPERNMTFLDGEECLVFVYKTDFDRKTVEQRIRKFIETHDLDYKKDCASAHTAVLSNAVRALKVRFKNPEHFVLFKLKYGNQL